MPPHIDPESLWIILRIQNGLFAVPCQHVQSIIVLTEIITVPNVPEYIRGVINYRDQVVYLIDMRKRLNITSLSDEINEFITMMDARQQDHVNWVNQLNESVIEEKEFTLTTDPHLCKFGQWYYQFLPTVEDTALRTLLENFERPHNDIHHAAIEVKQLLADGRKDKAISLIEEKKNYELRKMMDLFSQLKEFHRKNNREVTVILESSGRQFALIVDQVIMITRLAWDHWQSIEEVGASSTEKYLLGMAEVPDNSAPVIVMDVASLSIG